MFRSPATSNPVLGSNKPCSWDHGSIHATYSNANYLIISLYHDRWLPMLRLPRDNSLSNKPKLRNDFCKVISPIQFWDTRLLKLGTATGVSLFISESHKSLHLTIWQCRYITEPDSFYFIVHCCILLFIGIFCFLLSGISRDEHGHPTNTIL